MGITYNELAQKLQELEKRFKGNSKQRYRGSASAVRNSMKNFQCFVLDTETGISPDEELPVVVAIGINYCDGTTELPNLEKAKTLTKAPFVEDDTGCKTNATSLLDNAIKYKALWLAGGAASEELYSWRRPDKFHLVMTNLSPWITDDAWGSISNFDKVDIIANSNARAKHQVGYLDCLWSTIGPETTAVIGHGKDCAVGNHCISFIKDKGFKQWVLGPNLARGYSYRNHCFPRL